MSQEIADESVEKKVPQEKPRKKEPLSANRTEQYTYNKGETDKFELGHDTPKDWIQANPSRLGEAVVNPKNDRVMRNRFLFDLAEMLSDPAKELQAAKQLAYVAKYGPAEYKQRAEILVADYEAVSGKLPDIVDPAREDKAAVDDANLNAMQEAALADYKSMNEIASTNLFSILDSPLKSIPKDWYKTSEEILTEIETGQGDKVVGRILSYIEGGGRDLNSLKMTLELLLKYGSGEIKNEKAPKAHLYVSRILMSLEAELFEDVQDAKKKFNGGDINALNAVVGYEPLYQIAENILHTTFKNSINRSDAELKAYKMESNFRRKALSESYSGDKTMKEKLSATFGSPLPETWNRDKLQIKRYIREGQSPKVAEKLFAYLSEGKIVELQNSLSTIRSMMEASETEDEDRSIRSALRQFIEQITTGIQVAQKDFDDGDFDALKKVAGYGHIAAMAQRILDLSNVRSRWMN